MYVSSPHFLLRGKKRSFYSAVLEPEKGQMIGAIESKYVLLI